MALLLFAVGINLILFSLWCIWVIFVYYLCVERTDNIVFFVLMGFVLLFSTVIFFYVPCRWLANQARRTRRQAAQIGRGLEDGLTPAEISWRRRGWLIVLRARERRVELSAAGLKRWKVARVARRLLATVQSLRATRLSSTSTRAVLGNHVASRQNEDVASPLCSTEADAASYLREAVNTMVHLSEEGVFRNIVLYL